MSITYHEKNGFLIPNVIVPQSPRIGIWGKRRADYLRKNRRPIYTGMQLAGKLNAHLEEVDRQAREMMDLLTRQMAARENVTEQLKAQNQMLWVQRMNNIRDRAMEVVNNDLIYT